MGKLESANILVKNAKLTAVKLDNQNSFIKKIIDETKQKQAEILKLKELDKERLRMVVQL